MAPNPTSDVREFLANVWNAGEITTVSTYIHPEYSVDGQIVGSAWVAAKQIVAADELVAARLQMQGTHLGQWKEFAPTGRQVDYQEAAFWTVDPENGLIRSGHFVADALTLRIQLGLLPSTAWQTPGAL